MKRGFLNTPRYKRAIEEVDDATDTAKAKTKVISATKTTTTSAGSANKHKTVVGTNISGAGSATTRSAGVLEGGRDGAAHGSAAAPSPLADDADPKGKGKWKGKGKGKEKAVDVDSEASSDGSGDSSEYVVLERFPPRRSGWGRRPEEEYLHTVPRSHGGPGKKRAIFRMWPRRPNGRPIMPSERPKGTLSPDGYPWGATLYDFYAVKRIPEIQHALMYTTGSALLQDMKAMDELEAAAPEIEWALSEGKPRVEEVADTEELIMTQDTRVPLMDSFVWCGMNGEEEDPGKGKGKKRAAKDDDDDDKSEWATESDDDEKSEDAEDGKVEEYDGEEAEDEGEPETEFDDSEVDPASIPPPPTIPVTSPFHPIHYPKPWPIVPFEKSISVLLQERIPLHLLPRKLYVHDPFGVLHARERQFRNTSWDSRPDIVRTYSFKIFQPVLKGAVEAKKKAEAAEKFKARTLIMLRYKRTKEQIKNYEPMIEVPLPPYPRRKTKTEEGHLYLSPVAKVGEGNHSIVYKGEWELPRELFSKRRKLCEQCFKESADKEIQRLKDTGRWAKLLKAAAWGPKGFTGRQPTTAEMAAASDPTNLQRDGETLEREIICVVPPGASPMQIWEALDERKIWDVFMEKRGKTTAILDFAESSGKDKESDEGYVAVIRIDPPSSYATQETCAHRAEAPTPRTAMFTVIAKLSLEDDPHLVREARNYQQFPEHFFRHYDGYTLIRQLHAVVPVHAVVPQFYGYYAPQNEASSARREEQPYLSPILLLEHCGEPIDPETLSLEDQEECASLVLRFQQARWLHGSLAPRNFLVQKGNPTDFPLRRQVHPELSFRLIDFGRSKKYEKADEKRGEEGDALRMFQGLQGMMAMTLQI